MRRSSDVDPRVIRGRDHAALFVHGRGESVIDAIVGRGPAEGKVGRRRRSGSQKAIDVVVERRPGGIRSPEVEEGAEGSVARDGGRTVHPLELRRRPGGLQAEGAAVLHAATAFAPLGRDDDGAVCRIDAVERGGLRPLQHRQCLDVIRIEIGRAVREINGAIRERGIRVRVRCEHSRIESSVVHRQAVHDDQRLVAPAD